jgi:hypothetical protein
MDDSKERKETINVHLHASGFRRFASREELELKFLKPKVEEKGLAALLLHVSPLGTFGWQRSSRKPPTTVMPVQGIRTVASSRVSLESMPLLVDGLLIRRAEWRRRLHPPMQAPRLPLLRLGRQLERHEVRRLSFFPISFLSSLVAAPSLTFLP